MPVLLQSCTCHQNENDEGGQWLNLGVCFTDENALISFVEYMALYERKIEDAVRKEAKHPPTQSQEEQVECDGPIARVRLKLNHAKDGSEKGTRLEIRCEETDGERYFGAMLTLPQIRKFVDLVEAFEETIRRTSMKTDEATKTSPPPSPASGDTA